VTGKGICRRIERSDAVPATCCAHACSTRERYHSHPEYDSSDKMCDAEAVLTRCAMQKQF